MLDATNQSFALVPLAHPPGALALEPSHTSPVDVYLSTLSAQNGRRTMQSRIKVLAGLLGYSDSYAVPWHNLRYHHATALRARLQERYAPASANLALTALRRVLHACWRMGLMSAEEYHGAASVEAVIGERLLAGRALSSGEMAALLGACMDDPTPAGRRDAAIFALLYACGLRRAELVTLNVEDYDAASGALSILRAKRNKQRVVYVADAGASEALADWMTLRADRLGDAYASSGPLFVPILKSGKLLAQEITANGLASIVEARTSEAQLPHCTPHDFRRTMAGDLLDAGADLAIVQRIMGHSNVTTTARYDRRPEAAKKRAASLLRVPYRRTAQAARA